MGFASVQYVCTSLPHPGTSQVSTFQGLHASAAVDRPQTTHSSFPFMNYARALYLVTDATLDDLREAVTTLEETARLARRVLGGAHPTTVWIEGALQGARTKLAQSNT